jgi:hypothetical protein
MYDVPMTTVETVELLANTCLRLAASSVQLYGTEAKLQHPLVLIANEYKFAQVREHLELRYSKVGDARMTVTSDRNQSAKRTLQRQADGSWEV